MLIAQAKKKENIAEYLLYMWQVEDMIRANKLDIHLIEANIISKFDQPIEIKEQIRNWYLELIQMMLQENIQERGHLQINQEVIRELTVLHHKLLETNAEYSELYYKTLPFIVELRAKSVNKEEPELESCFSALYGYLLLKLQGKEISGETQAAVLQISSLLRFLSQKYKENNEAL